MSRPKRQAALKSEEATKLAYKSLKPRSKPNKTTKAEEVVKALSGIQNNPSDVLKFSSEDIGTEITPYPKESTKNKQIETQTELQSTSGVNSKVKRQSTITTKAKNVVVALPGVQNNSRNNDLIVSLKDIGTEITHFPKESTRKKQIETQNELQSTSGINSRVKRRATIKATEKIRNAIGIRSPNVAKPERSKSSTRTKLEAIVKSKDVTENDSTTRQSTYKRNIENDVIEIQASRPKRVAAIGNSPTTIRPTHKTKKITNEIITVTDSVLVIENSPITSPSRIDLTSSKTKSSPSKGARNSMKSITNPSRISTRATTKHVPIYRREISKPIAVVKPQPNATDGSGAKTAEPTVADVYSINVFDDSDTDQKNGKKKKKTIRKKPAIKNKTIARGEKLWSEKNVRKAKAIIKPHARALKTDFVDLVTMVNPTQKPQINVTKKPQSPDIIEISCSPKSWKPAKLQPSNKSKPNIIIHQIQTIYSPTLNKIHAQVHPVPKSPEKVQSSTTNQNENNNSMIQSFVYVDNDDGNDDGHFCDDYNMNDQFLDSHDENVPPPKSLTSTPMVPNRTEKLITLGHRLSPIKPRIPLQSLIITETQTERSPPKKQTQQLRKIILEKQLLNNQNAELVMNSKRSLSSTMLEGTPHERRKEGERGALDISDYFGFVGELEENQNLDEIQSHTNAPQSKLLDKLKELRENYIPKKLPPYSDVMSSTLINNQRHQPTSPTRQMPLRLGKQPSKYLPLLSRKKIAKKSIITELFDGGANISNYFTKNELDNQRVDGDDVPTSIVATKNYTKNKMIKTGTKKHAIHKKKMDGGGRNSSKSPSKKSAWDENDKKLQSFVNEFNSMCDEIDQFELPIEVVKNVPKSPLKTNVC